jgi:hypothetical protein
MRAPGFSSPSARAQTMQCGCNGLIATDRGECADHLQRLRRGRPTVFPHGMPRHPECRMPPTVPVELQQGLRGLGAGINEHLMQYGPQATFFEGFRSGRMLPHRREVLAQREPPVALFLAERAPPVGQRGEVGFHRRDLGEGLMPAPCSFSRHEPVVRLDPILLPSGPLDLVTRLLHGSCERLPWRIMGPLDLGEGHARCLDSCGLEGLQPGCRHSLIDTQAANRQAGRGAPINPASPTDIPGHTPRRPARGHLELAAAAPTPQQATEQRCAPFGRTTGCVLWHRALSLQELLVLEKHLPTESAGMGLEQHETPLFQGLLASCALAGPSICDHGLGCGTPRDQGASRARIRQHLMPTVSRRPLPADVVACRPCVHCG